MNAQKPLTSTPNGAETTPKKSDWIRLIEIIIKRSGIPRWARNTLIGLAIVYFLPGLIATWLNGILRLIIACREWQKLWNDSPPARGPMSR